MHIPILKPNPPKVKDWEKYIQMSYTSSIFSNGGPCSNLLEERLQAYLNIAYKPILMSNATVALTVVIDSFGLKNCEILIPTFTFAATAHSVLNAGCRPVLVDIEDDLCFSLNFAEKKISNLTKAMVVVQPLGYICDYVKYEEFAKKNNLILIFDSAATLGANYRDDTKVGHAGDCEIFSLHITKTFGIGEGALVTGKDPKFLNICRKKINFGFENNTSKMSGTNAKCSEFHAAVGLSVLDVISEKLKIKEEISNYYSNNLKCVKVIKRPSAYQVYPIIFESNEKRELAIISLSEKEIQTKIYYIPIHYQDYFKFLVDDEYIVTDYYADRILCIPFFEGILREEQDLVIQVIHQ